MSGHVFVIFGDLNELLCDAWLLPTDKQMHVVESQWCIDRRLVPEPPAEWRAKTTRVLRLEGTPAGAPVPYLTNVVSQELAPTVGSAVELVERAAADIANGAIGRATPRRSKPLVGVPLVGTGHGGKRRSAGEVVDALLPALEDAATRTGVDVALVLFDEAEFAATQAKRRERARPWPELDARQREVAARLAEHVRAGELVLFMGAGVSVPAGGPTWRELIASLSARAGLGQEEARALESLGPLDAARVVEDRLARLGLGLHETVRSLIPNERHSLTHALLGGLRVKEAVTTNYDQLYEKACRRPHGTEPAALPVQASRDAPSWVLKMHGSFAPGDDIVLTRTDYLRYETRRAALAGIVQALLMTRHMLFIGYSLQDETFLRMVDAVRRAISATGNGGPLGTVLSLTDDRFFEVIWRGELESLDFAAKSESAGDLAAASRKQEIFLDCLLTEASTTSKFLLDPRYRQLLSDSDRELAEILEETRTRLLASGRARESRASGAVWDLLVALGAPRPKA